ncbi:MAG: DUF3572 domain-containing protein [Blastomonas sp.]
MAETIGQQDEATGRLDAMTLALQMLGWMLSDDRRAERLLSLSGLTPDDLRSGAGDPAMLAGVMALIEAHEPDLVGAAQSLGVSPQRLVQARRELIA